MIPINSLVKFAQIINNYTKNKVIFKIRIGLEVYDIPIITILNCKLIDIIDHITSGKLYFLSMD